MYRSKRRVGLRSYTAVQHKRVVVGKKWRWGCRRTMIEGGSTLGCTTTPSNRRWCCDSTESSVPPTQALGNNDGLTALMLRRETHVERLAYIAKRAKVSNSHCDVICKYPTCTRDAKAQASQATFAKCSTGGRWWLTIHSDRGKPILPLHSKPERSGKHSVA